MRKKTAFFLMCEVANPPVKLCSTNHLSLVTFLLIHEMRVLRAMYERRTCGMSFVSSAVSGVCYACVGMGMESGRGEKKETRATDEETKVTSK